MNKPLSIHYNQIQLDIARPRGRAQTTEKHLEFPTRIPKEYKLDRLKTGKKTLISDAVPS